MSEFKLYFLLGRDHILDYAVGLDHMLFVIALGAIYQLRDWRRVLILVTAFTIGHSVTLALSTLNVIKVNIALIEFLIPVTIFITAASNLFRNDDSVSTRAVQINYFFASFFGLIHGLGFSNYLKSILGSNRDIISQLFAFNIGLEFGQIIIVGILLINGFILIELFGVNRRDWRLMISFTVAEISLFIILKNIFWS
jgi:hypothetical protein